MSSSGCSADTTEPFALRVIGDSMQPEFAHGHIIIVDPGLAPYQGAYVVLEHNGEVLFGQYQADASGVQLHYLNPTMDPVILDQEFRIKGVIVQRSSGRRKSLKHYHPPL